MHTCINTQIKTCTLTHVFKYITVLAYYKNSYTYIHTQQTLTNAYTHTCTDRQVADRQTDRQTDRETDCYLLLTVCYLIKQITSQNPSSN